jgi:hypothetical protein
VKSLLLLALLASPAHGQQPDLAARLAQRGAPPGFAQAVSQLTAQARADGLPVEPLADKAFEGLAKGYAPDRILTVVQALAIGLREGRAAVVSAKLPHPPGALVTAAAEALGRGMGRAEVQEILQAAPAPMDAAVGLTVAASLAAQGIVPADATRAVTDAYRHGRSSEEVLELPSVTSNWFAEGVGIPEVLKRIRSGAGLSFPPGLNRGTGAPPGDFPGKGPPINPPGKNKNPHHP